MKVPYKIAITNAAGIYWNPNGGAASNPFLDGTTPIFIQSIVDWDKFTISYNRDPIYLGMIRAYSPDMVRFAKTAAKVLRYIVNTQGGTEAQAYLAIYLWNSDDFEYQFLDSLQFNFHKHINDQFTFSAMLVSGGLAQLFKANAAQNYSIVLNDPALAPNFPEYNPLPVNDMPLTLPGNNPLPPPIPQYVYLDGIPILGEVQFVTEVPGESISNTFNTVGDSLAVIGQFTSNQLGDYLGQIGVFGSPVVNNNTHSPLVVGSAVANTVSLTGSQFSSSTVKIDYDLNFSYSNVFGADDIKIHFRYAVYDGIPAGTWGTLVGGATNLIVHDTVFIAPGATRQLHWVGESELIDILPGHLLAYGFLYEIPGPSGILSSAMQVDFGPTDVLNPLPAITLKCSFIPDTSVTRAITHFDLFQQLTAQMATNGGLLPNPLTTSPDTWAKSDLLTTHVDSEAAGNVDLDAASTYITCGDALRGLTVNTIVDPYYNGGLPFDQMVQPAIYTNMQDFSKDLFTELCAGIGIEKYGIGDEKIVAESLYYFFDDSIVIADLGSDISNFQITPLEEYVGSSIAFGESDQQFDSINGPLETNSEVNCSTPVVGITKSINNKSPYITSPYNIEITRANIGNKTNTNSSSDNSTYKLQTVGLVPLLLPVLDNWRSLSGYEPLVGDVVQVKAFSLQRANVISSGLPDSLLTPDVSPYEMYNLSFSPQRRARRALPWLCSNYRGMPSRLISISGAKKNISVISDLGSGDIAESDWLNVSEVPQTYTAPFSSAPVTVQPAPIPAGRSTAAIFLPKLISFTAPAIPDLLKLMTPPGTVGGGKMYGKIALTFIRDGVQFPLSGFVKSIGITPGDNKAYDYVLIASPTCIIPHLL